MTHVPASPERFSAGHRIGPYRLLQALGRGGFGEVWLADRDSVITKTRVAVKLPLEMAVDLNAVRRESELWVRASGHPNVLPIFEADIYDGQAIIVTEYAADGSLTDWLRNHADGKPDLASALAITLGILAGLNHLHGRGILHRDLKPSNILMQGDTPRLADFGLSRLVDQTATMSAVAGTPMYMAPEAFDGQRSVQTDLWAVGVILFQLVAGCVPFSAREHSVLLVSILGDPPPALPPEIPAFVRAVIARALAKDPRGRFSSAAEMAGALQQPLQAGAERPPSSAISGQRTLTDAAVLSPRRHHRRYLALGLIGAVAASALLLVGNTASWFGLVPTENSRPNAAVPEGTSPPAQEDLLRPGSVWVGTARLVVPGPDNGKTVDAKLQISTREGTRFTGRYSTLRETYVHEIAGTIEGESIAWRVSGVARRGTMTDLQVLGTVQNTWVRGNVHRDVIEAQYNVPQDTPFAALTFKLEP